MDLELVRQHWALLAGSVIGVAVALMVIHRAWQDSTRGRLRAAVGQLQLRRQEVARQERLLRKSERVLARLESKADSVAPRSIEEAREAVTDGKAMLKILGDQVLVAQTQVRTIIVEDFPPRRHEAMRHQYLDS